MTESRERGPRVVHCTLYRVQGAPRVLAFHFSRSADHMAEMMSLHVPVTMGALTESAFLAVRNEPERSLRTVQGAQESQPHQICSPCHHFFLCLFPPCCCKLSCIWRKLYKLKPILDTRNVLINCLRSLLFLLHGHFSLLLLLLVCLHLASL